jgi:hypothetical protein
MPPKPATRTISTPKSDKMVATVIDDWLHRISSFSMIGRPVRPIWVSGCRFLISPTSRRKASMASEFSAKSAPFFFWSTNRSVTNPIRP